MFQKISTNKNPIKSSLNKYFATLSSVKARFELTIRRVIHFCSRAIKKHARVAHPSITEIKKWTRVIGFPTRVKLLTIRETHKCIREASTSIRVINTSARVKNTSARVTHLTMTEAPIHRTSNKKGTHNGFLFSVLKVTYLVFSKSILFPRLYLRNSAARVIHFA